MFGNLALFYSAKRHVYVIKKLKFRFKNTLYSWRNKSLHHNWARSLSFWVYSCLTLST